MCFWAARRSNSCGWRIVLCWSCQAIAAKCRNKGRGMIRYIKVRKRALHRIEIFVDKIQQLFNSMDPSPFHEKDLDHDAEEFIVSWAQEYPRSDPLTLIVHLNQSADTADSQELVEKAVRNYFAYRAKLNRMEFKHLLKQGRTSLVIGLLFLATCLLI